MYTNPVLYVPHIDQGDPAVLRYLGVYYLYFTGRTKIRVYRSVDLVQWEYAGIALEASSDPNHWAQIDLWAPEVIYAEGKFYMYLAGTRRTENRGDDDQRRVGTAVSSYPQGPFILMDEPLVSEWSIDAHPFQDSDGDWYLFYNVRNASTRGPNGVVGCGNVVDRMSCFTELEGNPSLVCRPEFSWEGNLEQDWFWNEGPFTIKRLGKYYQMYSGGCFYQPTYHIAYAVSSTVKGTYLKWPRGTSRPILQSNEEVWGPGHHVITKGPNGIQDYAVYHGHSGSDSLRRNFIDPVFWHGDHLFIQGPTAHKKRGPFLPLISIDRWMVQGENFLDTEARNHYLWEFWIAASMEGQIFLGHESPTQGVSFQLETQQLLINGEVTVLDIPLFLEGYNHLRILRSGNGFSFWINDRLVWASDRVDCGPTRVGVQSQGMVDIKGLIYTPCVRQSFTKDPQSKASSGLIVNALHTSLDGWNKLSGEFCVMDYGVVGQGVRNEMALDFSAHNFQLELDSQEKIGLSLLFTRGEINVHYGFGTMESIGKFDSDVRMEALYHTEPEVGWDHVLITRMNLSVEVFINGIFLCELEIPGDVSLERLILTMTHRSVINNISLVEITDIAAAGG